MRKWFSERNLLWVMLVAIGAMSVATTVTLQNVQRGLEQIKEDKTVSQLRTKVTNADGNDVWVVSNQRPDEDFDDFKTRHDGEVSAVSGN